MAPWNSEGSHRVWNTHMILGESRATGVPILKGSSNPRFSSLDLLLTTNGSCPSCGHVYSRSCLERWLSKCRDNLGKCPRCMRTFEYKDIINLFSLPVAVPTPTRKASEEKYDPPTVEVVRSMTQHPSITHELRQQFDLMLQESSWKFDLKLQELHQEMRQILQRMQAEQMEAERQTLQELQAQMQFQCQECMARATSANSTSMGSFSSPVVAATTDADYRLHVPFSTNLRSNSVPCSKHF